MGLLFCCPSCGANLRVTADVAPLVSCPGCGEPIRVPHHPHPVESLATETHFPPSALIFARSGLRHLLVSLGLFTIALSVAATAFGVRLWIGRPVTYPNWFPVAQVTLAGLWVAFASLACACRMLGYTRCRQLATEVGVEAWAKAAAIGGGMTAVGVFAVIPWLIGRPALQLSPELIALVMIGVTCGLLGIGIEFAFLNVLHRLLWETVGWQVANNTSRYTMQFVFAIVTGMGSLCLGAMAAVMVGGDRTNSAVPWIGATVIAAVFGCALWTMGQYTKLLTTTLHALNQPEPQPPKVTYQAE